MIQARITRIASDPNHGTFGVLVIDGQPVCNTLEPYHRDNERNISSIPSGQYICKKYSSERYPSTYEVTGVQNRSSVLFHSGNWDDDTMGCILLGESFGTIGSDWVISQSRDAMTEFMQTMHGAEFKLTIVDCY
jgi:hypothetical protein